MKRFTLLSWLNVCSTRGHSNTAMQSCLLHICFVIKPADHFNVLKYLKNILFFFN